MCDKVESHPSPADLPVFLPYACRQLQAPFLVQVILQEQGEYVSLLEQASRKSMKSKQTRTSSISENIKSSEYSALGPDRDDTSVLVRVFHDSDGRLVEISFSYCTSLPPLLLKIIGFCMPCQTVLTKMTVRWTGLEGNSLLRIAELLSVSYLTELNLDDSPVPQRNYRVLLEGSTRLRVLSLARCGLGDKACAELADRLVHPLPAATTLVTLSLASDELTDESARSLAFALRSNRTLRHLDLAGNRIGDYGAESLFTAFTEFPLDYEELIDSRRRTLEHLKMRREVFAKYLTELTASIEKSSGSIARRRRLTLRSRKSTLAVSASTVTLRAQAMTEDVMGAHREPFTDATTVSRGGYVYSAGNASLCYLNLAYNNLGHPSAMRLLQVLEHQSRARGAPEHGPGLLRVVLDGNAVPTDCFEMYAIRDLIERAIARNVMKTSTLNKRSERSRSRYYEKTK